jgi:hypothetical protein
MIDTTDRAVHGSAHPSGAPHRRTLVRSSIALIVIALAAAATAWFQPYKLVIDDEVAETVPAQLVELGRGDFHSLEHETRGTAIVYRAPGGELLLRLSGLETSNGPDLRVILSSAPLSDDWHGWGDDAVEVAHLKGNVGSQNYPLPGGIDLSRHGRVVVWCDRFEVGFGVADIEIAAALA